MRLMGIDYGEKRIGIALSDESKTFSFPHSVVANDKNTIKNIEKICRENNVEKIILGESLNYKGQHNLIMRKIEKAKISLEKEINLPVIYEVEILTTKEAEHIYNKKTQRGEIAKKVKKEKIKDIDASAAALILKSYIEKQIMVK